MIARWCGEDTASTSAPSPTGIRGLFFASNVIGLTTKNDGPGPTSHPIPTTGRHRPLRNSRRNSVLALEDWCQGARRGVRTAGANYGPEFKMPYAHQVSLGVQQQVADTMAVEVDYVYTGHRIGRAISRGTSTTIRPRGSIFPSTTSANDPFPLGLCQLDDEWGPGPTTMPCRRSFTKRYSDRWQASGTYTLSAARDARPRPLQWVGRPGGINGSGFETVPFPTAVDLGGEYTLSGRDQRHRATINTIVDLGYDFQLSGLYFFGSGQRWYTNWGVDLRDLGDRRPNELRLRPDGTIVPRSDFVGDQVHRVDMRLQRRFPLGGRAAIDGILEVFNVFDNANFGNYEVEK